MSSMRSWDMLSNMQYKIHWMEFAIPCMMSLCWAPYMKRGGRPEKHDQYIQKFFEFHNPAVACALGCLIKFLTFMQRKRNRSDRRKLNHYHFQTNPVPKLGKGRVVRALGRSHKRIFCRYGVTPNQAALNSLLTAIVEGDPDVDGEKLANTHLSNSSHTWCPWRTLMMH